jgi:hypothetical protein
MTGTWIAVIALTAGGLIGWLLRTSLARATTGGKALDRRDGLQDVR